MANWVEKLNRTAAKKSRLVLGMMSGTSADAVDSALCEINGSGLGASVSIRYFSSYPYRADLKELVKKGPLLSLAEISELNIELGEMFAEAAISAIKAAGLSASGIDLIASHGQTVFHHSGQRKIKSTLQLGDGDVIAERVGTFVFSDFRIKDIAFGGEGAPLTPYCDAVLFGGKTSAGRRAVINLGGIANITILSDKPSEIIGFDVGPANAPLDRLAMIISGGKSVCDTDGLMASSGTVNGDLLKKLLAEDKFISRTPPKSTGFEAYGDKFVQGLIARHGKADADLMATAVEFCAQAIALGLKSQSAKHPVVELVAAGGGVKNKFLMRRIGDLIKPTQLRLSDEFGIPSQAREAAAFAILGNDALSGAATSLPSVTGAGASAVLGKLSFPSSN